MIWTSPASLSPSVSNIIEIIIMCVLCATIKRKNWTFPNRLHMGQHIHTHAYTHTEKKKNTLFQPEGGWGGRLKTPTRFSCEKNKSCHWPLSNVDPKLCVRSVGSASSPNLSLSLYTPHQPGNLLFVLCLRVDGKYMQISYPISSRSICASIASTFPFTFRLNLCSSDPWPPYTYPST